MAEDPPGAYHLPLTPGWRLWRTAALRAAGMPLEWLAPFALDGPDRGADRARRCSTEAVRDMLRHPPFLSALTWQNLKLVADWAGRYAEAVAEDPQAVLGRPRNYREAKLANYAQRYCAKNDTIGFFGAVGWARLTEDVPGIEVSGTGGLLSSTVYFEVWAVQQLADRWAADPRIAPYLPVRLHPAVSYTGGVLRAPRRPAVEPTGPRAALLAAIDGRRTVAEVLAHARASHPQLAGTDPYPAELDGLRADGIVLTGFPVPIDEAPEGSLAALAAAVPDAVLRAELAGQLDRLERARADAGRATGPRELRQALASAGEEFVKLAGDPPDRSGRLGRVPLYLDCRRDWQVSIGSGPLDRLRAPLALLLDSARWFVNQIGAELTDALRERYRTQRARSADGTVSLADLLLVSADLLAGAPGTPIHGIVVDLQERWRELLPSGDHTEVRLCADRLAPLAAALFPGGPAGWASGIYHSPDVMLGYLDGRDAPPVWVVGELHVALNTLESRVFHTQAADRDVLVASAAEDLRGGRILPLYPTDAGKANSRTYPPSALSLDVFGYWSYGADSGHPLGTPSWPGAAILVTEDGDQLVADLPDGGGRASVLECLGEFATALAVTHFSLRRPARHAPRIRIDDVVICRESWRLPADELVGVTGHDYGAEGLRRYLIELGVPRYVFYRTPAERKPCFLDLDAPLLLRNLVAAIGRVRRSAGCEPYVDLVEMLPDPQQTWLVGGDGQHYTSELRIVAVDTVARGPVRTGQTSSTAHAQCMPRPSPTNATRSPAASSPR